MKYDSLLFLFPFFAGSAVVLLSAMNGVMADILGSSLWAAALNKIFGVAGTATILMLQTAYTVYNQNEVLWTKGVRQIGADIRNDWKTIFILFGAFSDGTYTFCSVAFPLQIGSAAFFVAVTAGQVIMSVMIDLTGILWNQKKKIGLLTWLGLILVVIGTVTFQIQDLLAADFKVHFLILSMLAGAIRVSTAAFNRKVQSYVMNLFATASWIFGSTFIFLIIPSAIVTPNPTFSNVEPSDWWLFFAFILAVFASIVNTTIPKKIGYSANYGWTVCGQLLASLIVDATGFLKDKKIGLTVFRMTGLAMTGIGVVLMQVDTHLKQKQSKIGNEDKQSNDNDDDDSVTTNTDSSIESGDNVSEIDDKVEEASVEVSDGSQE